MAPGKWNGMELGVGLPFDYWSVGYLRVADFQHGAGKGRSVKQPACRCGQGSASEVYVWKGRIFCSIVRDGCMDLALACMQQSINRWIFEDEIGVL